MKLVDNWRDILRSAASVKLMALSAVLSALPLFFQLLNAKALGVDPVVFAALAAGASALAVVARVIHQVALSDVVKRFATDESGAMCLRKRTITGAVAIFAVAATPFVAKWEGLRTEAYQDVVGVWTVCYGETKGVRPGDSYTRAECDAMLDEELHAYAAGLAKCLKAPLPEGAAVAFLSLSYNIGTAAACRSTAVRRANAGDLFGACDALLMWNKGRVNGKLQMIPGLKNRREDEHRLCVDALRGAGLSR